MHKEVLENIPNAGRLMEALRNTGYSNISAISDLVDNSIDAKADKIRISLRLSSEEDVERKITISDNGTGMNWETLRQAMRLGSDVFHDLGRDLGKYGMGLVTASISIGRRLTVISRKDGITNTAIQDLDKIIESNRFEIALRPATEPEIQLFDQETNRATSGTVVIISKCDRVQYTNESEFARELENEVGRIFRAFMREEDSRIYINDNLVELNDPLWLNDSKTDVIINEDCEITIGDQTKNIHLRAVMLPDYGKKVNSACGFNMKNQGFYLMRNHREIASGITLGIFKKHNDFNRMRIELEFGSDLDDDMGVNFTKRDAKPSQAVIDKVTEVTNTLIETIRRRIKDEQTARRIERAQSLSQPELTQSELSQSDSSQSESSEISQSVETPKAPATSASHPVEAKTDSIQSPAEEASSQSPSRFTFEYETRPLAGDLFFDMVSVGPKRIIYFNTNSNIYQKLIAQSPDPSYTEALAFHLVGSMLVAAQRAKLDDATAKSFNRAFLQILQELKDEH